MFRIGILGSDNSHALAFSKLVNIPDEKTGEFAFPDARVTSIFGLDKKRTEEVARDGKIEFIAEKPEDLMDRVDAVMVVFRHGDLHAEYALPFIEAGIPAWIDKPFTIRISDAKRLIEAAEKNNTLLTGGSTCKYAYDVLMLKNAVENQQDKIGLVSAALNFPADPKSEYGGIFFYGPHMAEMLMTIFGYDVQSVTATEKNGNIVAVAKYDQYQVVLNFAQSVSNYYAVLYGAKKTIIREIDISIIYKLGFAEFINMLRAGRRPFELNKLLAPTVLLHAVSEALKTGREVFLRDMG